MESKTAGKDMCLIDSFQCMTKPTTKVISLQLIKKKSYLKPILFLTNLSTYHMIAFEA